MGEKNSEPHLAYDSVWKERDNKETSTEILREFCEYETVVKKKYIIVFIY